MINDFNDLKKDPIWLLLFALSQFLFSIFSFYLEATNGILCAEYNIRLMDDKTNSIIPRYSTKSISSCNAYPINGSITLG